MSRAKGVVYLIGAGPGDPELITVKGARLLETCDAVVYDNLVANELIYSLPEDSEKHYVGKRAGAHCLSQDQINRLLVRLARRGKRVARLKGGDPFVFGRGAEEARALKRSGIRFEVVSGVTSGVAALAYNGIPATDRERSSFVIFATGHKAGDKIRSSVPWEWVGRARRGTIVIYMGMAELPGIVRKLRAAGMPSRTPAALIERGTFPSQRVVTATVGSLPAMARRARIRPPAVIVIGEVVGLQGQLRWYERRPLSGVRVMVTRPPGQTAELHDALRGLGAEVLYYPCVATRTADDPRGWRALARMRDGKRWLVFTSENGARHFLDRYLKLHRDIRRLHGFSIAAVGRATARALRERGLSIDLLPPKATVAKLAEAMLRRGVLKGAAVLRVRGNLADRTFEDRLRRAGVRTASLTSYRTYHPRWSEGLKGKLMDHPPHVIIFTSSSAVEGYFANLAGDARRTAREALIASIGPMTTRTLRSRRLKASVEAGRHTVPDLVRSLARRFRR